MQKLIDGQWISCAQEDLVNGDTYRLSVGNGGWQQQMYSDVTIQVTTMTSPKDIVLLFPDESLAELDDLATDKQQPKADRGKARKVLTILSGSEPLEVSSPMFQGLLSWATILDSFSQTDIDNLNTTLGV